MGFSRNLLEGLAQFLEDQSVGVWSATGSYQATDTAIVVQTVPETLPRLVSLSRYPVSDDPSLSNSVVGVQVLTRWDGADPRPVDDLDDLIFEVLHGRTNLLLSTGVRIVQCLRQSGAPLGQDSSKRWSRSTNYYLDVHRPSANRT